MVIRRILNWWDGLLDRAYGKKHRWTVKRGRTPDDMRKSEFDLYLDGVYHIVDVYCTQCGEERVVFIDDLNNGGNYPEWRGCEPK